MKEKGGHELNTEALVGKTNEVIDKYKDQFKNLPDQFNRQLHDEIVKYFLASPGRFEKDDKKGLSVSEFETYSAAMLRKVSELMKEYAPTEEDIRQMKEVKKQAEVAGKAAEAIKPLDVKEIQENPGEINYLQT